MYSFISDAWTVMMDIGAVSLRTVHWLYHHGRQLSVLSLWHIEIEKSEYINIHPFYLLHACSFVAKVKHFFVTPVQHSCLATVLWSSHGKHSATMFHSSEIKNWKCNFTNTVKLVVCFISVESLIWLDTHIAILFIFEYL